MDLNERLKVERERLGLSQTAFAALAGASKHAQINWEKGVASPNAAALAAWTAVGLDVLYVVSGERSHGTAPAQPLKPDEAALLDNYRHSPSQDQDALRRTSAAFARAAGRKAA